MEFLIRTMGNECLAKELQPFNRFVVPLWANICG